MANQTKKEHTVPKAYLKNFSRKVGKMDKVIVIDKNKTEPYSNSIDNVACHNNFYEVEGKKTNYWEEYYGRIETKIPFVLNSIIINCRFASNHSFVLSDYLKSELTDIIIIQLFRTEKARKHYSKIGLEISNTFTENINEELKGYIDIEQINILNKYKNNENFVYSIQLEHTNSNKFIRKIKQILSNKIWVVHKNLNSKTYPFVTSDNPVILSNYINNKIGYENGLNEEGTIIYFPINSELLIAIYPNLSALTKYQNMVDYLDDVEFVLKLNKNNYLQCHRQVFFSIK